MSNVSLPEKNMFISNIFRSGIFNFSILLTLVFSLMACGGGSKLSLKEAKDVTLNYHGDNYTPPPRGVAKLINEIKSAGKGLIQDKICRLCDAMDPDDPDLKIRLRNLSKLAIISHMRGDSHQALRYIKQAVALLDHDEIKNLYMEISRDSFDHTYINVLHRAATITMDIGRYSDSIRYIKRAIELNEAKYKPWRGKGLFQYTFLAIAYAELGDIDEAESAFDVADYYYSIMGYGNQRAVDNALKREQEVLMVNGIIQNSQGELREAEEYFRQAITSMAKHSRGKKGWTWRSRAKVMGPYLVNNLLIQGRTAEAEAQAIEAIRYSLNKFGYESHVTATVLQSFIKVLIARERYDDARKIIKLTEHIFNKINANASSLQQVKLKMSLADIYIAKDDWSSAKKIYRQVYDSLASEPEVRKGLFYDNLNWAVVLAFTNQTDAAEKIAQAAVEKNSDVFGLEHSNTAMARGILAMVKARSGNNEAAKTIFEDIIPVFILARDNQQTSAVDTQKTRLIMESYLSMLAEEYKRGNKISASRAFYVSQLVQGRNIQNALAASAARASIKDQELIKLVRQEQDAKQKIKSGYNTLVTNYNLAGGERKSLVSNTKSRIDELVKAREAILNEINNRFPEYENMVRPKPVTIGQAKAILHKDEALLMTYSGSNNLYIWTLSSNGQFYLNKVGIGKKQLFAKVNKLRKALELQVSSLNEIPVFNVNLAHEFYNNVLRRSAHIWRSSKNLVIIADGALSSLPFSVFVTEEPDDIYHNEKLRFSSYRNISWLASRYATSYVPSVSTLINLRKLKVQKKPTMQFAGFGDPVFGTSGTQVTSASAVIKSRGKVKLSLRGLRKIKSGSLDNKQISTSKLDMLVALPETADEVLKVAAALKVSNKGNVFLGAEANEQRVKNMPLNNRRVLMFATHALLPGDLDGLVQPAIALSAPTVAMGTDKNDGLLTMGEVMGLNLNADWVVLSACNTGAASGRGATAVSGLGQAFFYAGARSILVSHWPVETTSAKEITTGLFDKQTRDKSLTRAMALNETIKELIYTKKYKNNSGDAVFSYAHPAFWAPFTVIGDGAGTLQ
ncbi:MAG: tetratricopeptide repeat protein [Gammaproteobacteria bacterium]|nr:MAG: tetratricopeptide repeat protein [Gammaproteobacteria bacterium]